MIVLIDYEGFIASNTPVISELGVYNLYSQQLQTYLITPPCSLDTLEETEKVENNYLSSYRHHLPLDIKGLPFLALPTILHNIFLQTKIILVYGERKQNHLQTWLDHLKFSNYIQIFNIQLAYPVLHYLKYDLGHSCSNHRSKTQHCVYNKIQAILLEGVKDYVRVFNKH